VAVVVFILFFFILFTLGGVVKGRVEVDWVASFINEARSLEGRLTPYSDWERSYEVHIYDIYENTCCRTAVVILYRFFFIHYSHYLYP